MPGVIQDILSSDEKATLKKSDAPSLTKNFSKILRPPLRSMDVETFDLAKEDPHLATADPIRLSESGSDDGQNHFEPAKQYRLEEEVRIRDFAFHGLTMDQINLKATRLPSSVSGSHISDETVTRISENPVDRNLWGTSQGLSASPSRVVHPQTAKQSPLNVLSSSVTESILLNAAPPLDYRTMNVIPASRKKSGTPSPPPNKPLPPIPEAQSFPQFPLEVSQSTNQEMAAFSSGREPPIPPKSPRRSKRNTLHIADDRELEALVSLNSSAGPKDDHHVHNPDQSGDSGSSSPNSGCHEVIRTHDDLLQWRKLRNEKTQARKKRDLEQSRTEHRPTNGMHDSKPDVADDTDDTIILPVVTSSIRSSAFSPDKTVQSPHLDRWNHLRVTTDSKSSLTLMAPPVIPRPTSSLSNETRSFSPQPRRCSPTKPINSGEAGLSTNAKAPVVLQPAPLHTGRNVRILSTTRPLYKHSTQSTLYIPPSPPLSPMAPTFDEDTTPKKLSNRASFARHRSSNSYSTIIEPEAENDPEDFSLYPSETEVQLQTELAAEKKRSALLKAALVAMINASAQYDSPPASEAGHRLSSLSGNSVGSAPLESALEAMLNSITGEKI
ncbi:hypothetical protein MMC17_000949 [Xylographa soralifera]|nr:hypothetical protein [Xylographa soralifera]